MNKYRARKVTVDFIRFDSTAEAKRYGELKLLRRAKEITDIAVHPVFHFDVAGIRVAPYIADFQYYDLRSGKTVVEDVKSPVTAKLSTFRMKKKLMLALYGIEIKEVRA